MCIERNGGGREKKGQAFIKHLCAQQLYISVYLPLSLPFACSGTLGRLLNLFVLQFSQLYNGKNIV